MVSTEGGTIAPQQATENLTFRIQVPMVIPKEIRDLKLAGQLPAGDIAYIDTAEPDTLRFVDQETWKPVIKKGVENRTSLDRAPKKFAGIILHTPSRSPEDSFEEEIQKVSNLLKRKIQKDERGTTTGQNLGVLFIVEDKGEDTRIGWRQKQLAEQGLVVDTTHDGSVIETGPYIVTFARRQKQHPTIDLTGGRISGNMFPPFTDEIRRRADKQGFTADTTELDKEAQATNHPRRTLGALHTGERGVKFTRMDNDGKAIVVDVSRNGTQTVSNPEGLRELTQQQGQDKKPSPIEKHEPGDKVTTDMACWECGEHFQDEYYKQAGNVKWFLKRDRVCHGSHSNGYPKYAEQGIYEGTLGFLPQDMQKPAPKKS